MSELLIVVLFNNELLIDVVFNMVEPETLNVDKIVDIERHSKKRAMH